MQPTIPHNLPTDTKTPARDPEADYGEMQPPAYMKRTGSEVKYEPLSKFEDKLFRDTVLNPNSAIKDADVIQTKSIIAGSTLVDNDFRMNPVGPKK